MTAAALSVDRARAIGAAGATLCAGATLLGRHSLLRPALIAAASILGAVWLGVEPAARAGAKAAACCSRGLF